MSYVSKQFLVFDSSSTANFRAWGSAISAAISGMGWLQTADPQINWTTVTAPTSGQYAGSEWWQPQDGLKNFILRIEYGASTGVPLGNNLRFTVCESTDGAGNITGWSTGAWTGGSTESGKGSGNTFDCYFSGDVNRMGIFLWRSVLGSGAGPQFVIVERTHNVDGTDNEEGVSLCTGSTSNPFLGLVNLTYNAGGSPSITNRGQITMLYDAITTSQLWNGTIPAFPAFPVYAGKYGNPLKSICFVHAQDAPEGGLIPVTQYGVSHTYFCTGVNSGVFPNATNYRYCMRYD